MTFLALHADEPLPEGDGGGALFELLPDALLVLDADDVIANVNAAAEQLFGVSRRQLFGTSLLTLLDKDSPVLLMAATARAEHSVVSEREMRVKRPPRTDQVGLRRPMRRGTRRTAKTARDIQGPPSLRTASPSQPHTGRCALGGRPCRIPGP